LSFRLRHERHDNAFGKDPTTWVLEDDAGNRLDVWPALGFNAFRWTASGVDLLDCDPAFFQIQKPTRSGFPILFPFPNRIRDGRFNWGGKTRQLPLNDSTGKNAIHGFSVNAAWQPTANDATLTGRLDLPGDAALWPSAATLVVEYQLSSNVLQVTARVTSHAETLPFGLGYHPYFSVAPFGGDAALVVLAAEQMWELQDNLPTGRRVPPRPDKDMRAGLPFASLALDDAYTNLTPKPATNGLGWIGGLRHPQHGRHLDLFVSPAFREVVAFTPPHRRAVCLEPYTCTTDAVNLQARGIDAGWMELASRTTWEATVRLEFTP
jgi:aldose 1-epimerase